MQLLYLMIIKRLIIPNNLTNNHSHERFWQCATERRSFSVNKKVLLRERKRHTARRVVLAIPGGVPRQKIFFPVWTCIKPNLVSKIFPFTGWGGGGGGGGKSLDKNFFSGLNMYQAKYGVKNFSLYGGGSPQQKFFSQSEHVSSQIWCQNFFPLPGEGSLNKKFFCQSEHVSSQIWCQKFFPLLRLGTPPWSETRYPPPTWTWTWDPPTWTWTWDPPTWTWDPPYLDLGPPPKCGLTHKVKI